MSRKNKRRSNRSGSAALRKKGRRQQNRSFVARVKAGWVARQPIFRFVLLFGVLMGLFYACTSFISFYKEQFFPAYLHLNAQISGAILNALAQEVTVAGEVVASSAFSISIKQGCDGIEPLALFIAAVLAFPVPFLRKLPGMAVGTFFLLTLNLVRIITLFFIGLYATPQMFELAHLNWWPALFILLAIVCWALSIQWAVHGQKEGRFLIQK